MREADNLGFAGRRDRLAPVIEGAFELPLIARASTGRHWKKLDEAQRARLVGHHGPRLWEVRSTSFRSPRRGAGRPTRLGV